MISSTENQIIEENCGLENCEYIMEINNTLMQNHKLINQRVNEMIVNSIAKLKQNKVRQILMQYIKKQIVMQSIKKKKR